MILVRNDDAGKILLIQRLLSGEGLPGWSRGVAAICVDDWQLHKNFPDVIANAPLSFPPVLREADHILWVDNESSLDAASAILLSPSVGIIGLDRETKPQFTVGAQQYKCSILQIATRDFGFIFDIQASVSL